MMQPRPECNGKSSIPASKDAVADGKLPLRMEGMPFCEFSSYSVKECIFQSKENISDLKSDHASCTSPPPYRNSANGEPSSVHLEEDSLDEDSDEDYHPDNEETSGSGSNDESCKDDSNISGTLKKRKTDKSFSGSVDLNAAISKAPHAITVKKSSFTADGDRIYDKVHYCVFCNLPQSKIARHLERKHKKEAMVSAALKLPAKSKERKRKLDLLRSKGDLKHNDVVFKTGKGEIVPLKCLRTTREYSQYLGCRLCGALCIKKYLWKHERHCGRVNDGNKKKASHCQMAAAMMTSSLPSTVDDFRHNVLSRMHYDQISLIIKNDPLILKYGENMFERLRHDPTQYNYISCKMRELGRFVLALKSVNKSIMFLSEALVPMHYNDVVLAIQKVAEYSELTNEYKIPSLALKLQTSLKVCACALKSQAFIDSNDALAEEIFKFEKLIDMNYSRKVSSHALRTLATKKWNKPLILPVTSDIVKLHEYLQAEGDKQQTELEKNSSKQAWYTLNKIVLASIILFNRRREGETSKILLHTFKNHATVSPLHEDMKLVLSKFEQQLVMTLARIEIRGKRGKKVPVIITADIKNKLDLLVERRKHIGVAEANKYLFARPYENSTGFIRGHDCIREFSHLCGAKEPSAISSTKLRKHVATISQIVSLKDNELDILAGFLGHDIRVHRQYYRLPEATLQVAKIGKMLLGLEKGLVHEFQGKTLDEINICDQEAVDVDDEKGSNDSEILQNHEEAALLTSMKAQRMTTKQCVELEEPTGIILGNDATNTNSIELAPTTRYSKAKHQSPIEQPVNTKTTRKKGHVQRWTQAEKDAVEKHMHRFLVLNRIPGKEACEDCLDKCDALKKRTWKHIKYYIYNKLKK